MRTKGIQQETRQKILLLLASGITLGLARSPRNYFRVLKNASRAWKDIDRSKLYRLVREFYKERIVDYKENSDGTIEIVLTKNGRKRILKYHFDNIEINIPDKWDKKWRMVIFDIPEKKRKARDELRNKLRELGFEELQKSAFIFPYQCEDEIDFIVEFFEIRPHVHFLLIDSFTNEEKYRIKFELF